MFFPFFIFFHVFLLFARTIMYNQRIFFFNPDEITIKIVFKQKLCECLSSITEKQLV